MIQDYIISALNLCVVSSLVCVHTCVWTFYVCMYVCACIRTCVCACEYVIHIIMVVLPVLYCHLDSYVLPGVDEGSQFVNKKKFLLFYGKN